MFGKSWTYKRFTISEIPNWQCPTCNSATLVPDGDFLERDVASYQKVPDSYFDESTGEEVPLQKDDLKGLKRRFTGFLKCSSKNCNECVVISGVIDTDAYYDENQDPFSGIDSADFYYPYYFNPPVHIIRISDKYPPEIQEELEQCFSLYWLDNSACANKIRSVVEIILDHLKIPRRKKNKKGGYERLSLHWRLDAYKKKNPEAADFLLSIKWIGNSGSHLDALNITNVLDSFLLLDHTLNDIFIKDRVRLKVLSKKINKKKRP